MFDLDIQSTKEAVSLGASGLALFSTGYFWLVRANRERMKLTLHPVGKLWGNVPMPQEDPDAYQTLKPEEGSVCATYGADLAVVNHSSLPNALLGVRAWLELADGTWCEALVRLHDTKHPEQAELKMPLNLSPLTTAGLGMRLSVAVPGNYDGGFHGREVTAGDSLAATPQLRVELAALQGKFAFDQLTLPAEGLKRTSLAAAA